MDKGTLDRKLNIKARIEQIGHELGIPDPGMAARIVEIAAIERLTEETSALRRELACWHGESKGVRGIWKKAIAYLASQFKSEDP